ncbi:MAG: ubiquinone biosynthesis regulatory protein kinase UbiB [Gammaproteobacteria bacterium]|nr:ubiquinone biosynthesis regulatory protein kinase UbiB [Gammaproteobacteria bacterium]
MKNGQDIVIKVVRPGIEGVIKKDLKLLYAIASLIERFGEDTRRLHPIEVVKEYENTIMGELDLKAEGANASVLKSNFEESDLLYIPRIYWEFSSKNVLVMDRIVGIPVTDVKKLKSLNVDFKLLAERGVEIFFTQVLHHNFFHADMHPGNIFVDASNPRSPTYIGIDCAIIGSLSNENQYYIARNLLAIFQRDYQLVAELHIQSGWVPKNTSVLALTGAVRTVCEPIFQRPLNEISLGHILIDLFATARDFQMEVQPALVLLQKTLLNIEGLGRQLYPELDLWNTAKPFLEQWLKNRYSPKSIIKKLKKNGPDIIEKISEVPMTLQEILQTLKNLDKIDGPSKNASSTNPKTNNEGKYVYLLIGLSLGVFGSYLLFTMSYW